jgi:hypothetical protein
VSVTDPFSAFFSWPECLVGDLAFEMGISRHACRLTSPQVALGAHCLCVGVSVTDPFSAFFSWPECLVGDLAFEMGRELEE